MASALFRARQAAVLSFLLATLYLLWRSTDQSPAAVSFHQSSHVALVAERLGDDGEGKQRLINSTLQLSGRPLRVLVTGSDSDGGKGRLKQSAGAQTCKIPRLDMNGSEVISFFKEPQPLECARMFEKNWAYVDDQRRFALIDERKTASCEVQSFSRKNDDELIHGEWKAINHGDTLTNDFYLVKCRALHQKWSSLLMTVAENPLRKEQLLNTKRQHDWSGLDVFFLGFDSLSQQTFRRKLPKTVAFLEETLGSVVLNGYNIVGDGTPQAFIPILTGQTEEELPLTRKRFKESSYVDDVYPFVWKNFSDAGYMTIYGEDAAGIGTFTYRLKGFRNQPTDHYVRTFFQEAEPKLRNWKCLGSEPVHKSWLRYSREFMSVYARLPRFLLMHHSLLSHDDINLVNVIDDDLSTHLRDMHEAGAFDRALVVVMADHGHRFAQLRNTHQGQLEERLPFMSLVLPRDFREGRGKKAWQNLQNNKEHLTSPFDIHATLLDILHWPTDEQADEIQDPSQHRSLSLFRPIPEGRTCDQAGIEPHWCTCLNWQSSMQKEDEKQMSLVLARAVVDTMNAQTAPERASCATLELNELLDAKWLVPNDGLLKYGGVKDADGFVPDLSGTTKPAFAIHQLKLATKPGSAIYEATVEYNSVTSEVRIDLASISHVNKFGDDPHCIIDRNYFLATYCVCYDRIGASD